MKTLWILAAAATFAACHNRSDEDMGAAPDRGDSTAVTPADTSAAQPTTKYDTTSTAQPTAPSADTSMAQPTTPSSDSSMTQPTAPSAGYDTTSTTQPTAPSTGYDTTSTSQPTAPSAGYDTTSTAVPPTATDTTMNPASPTTDSSSTQK